MRKLFLTTIISLFTICSYAQWSNTGDSRTAGDLYLGTNTNTFGEGKKLYFEGNSWNFFVPSIYKYNTQGNSGELRVQLGVYYRDYHKLNIGIINSETTEKRWMSCLAVTSSGKVGINQANPQYNLHVGGDGHIATNFSIMGNVGIGTTNPAYKLDVIGTIRAKEIRVNTGGADFVFDDNYKLKSLEEVKAHIDENKHLPGIPSAAEMQENGVGISELSTLLLQKVEELTLYAIEQNKKIESLTKEMEELRNQK